MKDMFNMMKKAQEMQKNMQKLQDELSDVVMQGQAGGGVVTIEMTCRHQVRSVKIQPEAVDADDIETLEDLIAAAVNDAHTKVESHVAAEMGKITGGVSLPGM